MTSPVDHQAAGRQSADHQAVDHQAVDHQSADHQSADDQSADDQSADDQSADHQAVDRRAPGHQSADDQSADDQAVDDQAVDHQAVDHQSADHAERRLVERWFRLSGVPAFVSGNARPASVLRHWYEVLLVAVLIGGGLELTARVVDYAGWLRTPAAQVLIWAGGLAIGYLATAVGLVEVAAFALRWFARIAWRSGAGMLRILPVLLVALVFTFLSAETWQSIGRLTGAPLVLASLLVFGLALVPLLRSSAIESHADLHDRAAVRGALPPDLAVGSWLPGDGPLTLPPLRWSERVNLRLVAVLGKGMVAVVVGVIVAAFFLVFGVLVVDATVTASWSGAAPGVWWQFHLGAHTYTLTAEHVRVAMFLGVFSAMYFIVSASTDRELAAALSADTEAHVTRCLAVRAAYRTVDAPVPRSAGDIADDGAEEAEAADAGVAADAGHTRPRSPQNSDAADVPVAEPPRSSVI